MKTLLITGSLLWHIAATAPGSYAQNTAIINQSGSSGNSTIITQTGTDSQVHINQNNSAAIEADKPENRVSLRMPEKATMTVNQQSSGNGPVGSNWVEISQDGPSTAIINQSSGPDPHTMTTPLERPRSSPRSTKRPKSRF